VVTRELQVERKTDKVLRPKTDVLPLCLSNLLRILGSKLLGGTKPTIKKVGWDTRRSHLSPPPVVAPLDMDAQGGIKARARYCGFDKSS